MGEYWVGVGMALSLGLAMAISPCPLATNVAAISYLGRRATRPRLVLLSGLLYTVGRTLVYLVLGILLVASLLGKSQVSEFLEKYIDKLLGPIFLVLAMFMLGLIRFSISGPGMGERMQRRVDALGVWGALLLGILFALSFCPFSAGVFFGMITWAVKVRSSVVLPTVFGIATALPVMAFAVLIALSAQTVGKAFNRVSQIEWWVRNIAGGIFLAMGIHYTLKQVFEVIPFWDPWVQYLQNQIWGAKA